MIPTVGQLEHRSDSGSRRIHEQHWHASDLAAFDIGALVRLEPYYYFTARQGSGALLIGDRTRAPAGATAVPVASYWWQRPRHEPGRPPPSEMMKTPLRRVEAPKERAGSSAGSGGMIEVIARANASWSRSDESSRLYSAHHAQDSAPATGCMVSQTSYP